MFTGFPEETIRFFLYLRFHNSTTWYRENKERYLREVQTPFYELIGELVPLMQRIDPQMEIRPHKILSRIRRDTRFSRDKTPYRDHLWLWFKRAGEDRWQSLGYWFELGPQRVMWGMATWDENRPLMDRFRRELASDPARYGGIIHGCGLAQHRLVMDSDCFKRMEVPSGIPEDLHPWYRIRSLGIIQTQASFEETASRALLGHVAADFEAMAPIYRMLRGMQDALEEERSAPPPPKRQDEWE
ncbi:MAG: DUF2461 domain-containing protein [Clostridia bacterium]|nr:DUF2461 domain-containing protein [Clostridia bacterium]